MNARTAGRIAYGAIAAGFILRGFALIQMAQPGDAWAGDAVVYRDTVEGFLRGAIDPDLWVWTPGFPLLAAPFALLFGAPFALHIVSFVAGAAIPLLAFLVGRSFGDVRTAAFAAFALAFSPELVLAGARPLSDAPALALLLAALFLLARHATHSRGAQHPGARRVDRKRAGPGTLDPKDSAPSRGAADRGARFLAVGVAGAAAGFAVLARPETLLAVPFLPLVSHGVRPRRVHGVYFALTALVIAPYVVGLRAASGVWGLSLKPAMNLLKLDVYERAPQYYQARAAWARTLASVSDESGELNPRKLALAASGHRAFSPEAVVPRWFGHVRAGLQQTRPEIVVLALLGIVGLVFPGPGRARAAFTALSLPFLGVPLFVNPLGRFLLPAVPGHAWGLGRLVATLADRAGPRGSVAAATVLALGGLFVAGRGLARVHADAGEGARQAQLVEIEAAINEQRIDRADRLLGYFRARHPDHATGLLLHGRLADLRGDAAAADSAYREGAARGGSPVSFIEFLVRTGRLAEADSTVRATDTGRLETADARKVLGHLAFARGRIDEALEEFLAAERLEGATPENQFNLAVVFDRLGRYNEARARLERVASSGNAGLAARARAMIAARDAKRDAPPPDVPGDLAPPRSTAPYDTSNLTP